MPRFFIARPSKIYSNWDFWFENKPSGNPDQEKNPTIVSYNVKICNATSSPVRLKTRIFSSATKNAPAYQNAGAVVVNF
jgi:uncharacterized protein affecting Mg2+/Co2+ transport